MDNLENITLRQFVLLTRSVKYVIAKKQVSILKDKIRQARVRYRRAKANNQLCLRDMLWLQMAQDIYIMKMFKAYLQKTAMLLDA